MCVVCGEGSLPVHLPWPRSIFFETPCWTLSLDSLDSLSRLSRLSLSTLARLCKTLARSGCRSSGLSFASRSPPVPAWRQSSRARATPAWRRAHGHGDGQGTRHLRSVTHRSSQLPLVATNASPAFPTPLLTPAHTLERAAPQPAHRVVPNIGPRRHLPP